MSPSPTEVVSAVDRVVDPCSAAQGTPLGLAGMGLLSNVHIDGGHVQVTLRLTSPCCAYGPQLAAAAADEVRGISGVTDTAVTIDPAAVWIPALMSETAREALDSRRRRTLRLTDARPFDWTSWR